MLEENFNIVASLHFSDFSCRKSRLIYTFAYANAFEQTVLR